MTGAKMNVAAAERSVAGFTTLDDFLDENGIREEATIAATKRVIAWQIEQAMTERKLTKVGMAQLMETSRAQLDRLLDPAAGNVTLETLARAAKAVGRRLSVELV